MVSVLCRGVGLLAKSLTGLSCTQATRCSSFPGALSALQSSTTRWFSKQQDQDTLPKRPLAAFFRFLVEQRPITAKLNPETKSMEVCKLVGLEWRKLSESAKKRYVEAANEDILKYKDEVRKYKENLSPLQIQLLKEEKRQKRLKKQSKRIKKEMIIFGKPKGPKIAVNIFVASIFSEATGASSQEKMKNIYDKWKNLPHSEKQMYEQLAQDDKIRYQHEIKAWEEQMIETERADLVQLQTQKKFIEKLLMQKAKSRKKAAERNVNNLPKPAT